MKKNLLYGACACLFCLMSVNAFAECKCSTKGCTHCEDTEEYLEEMGEYLKKEARKIKKMARRMDKTDNTGGCQVNDADFLFMQGETLDKNGDLVLWYADVAEDDVMELPSTRKAQAQKDAAQMIVDGNAMKELAKNQKELCPPFEDVVAGEIVEKPTNKNRVRHKKVSKKMPQMFYIQSLEAYGDNLVEVGETIQENVN